MNIIQFSLKSILLITFTLELIACSREAPYILITIADARVNAAQFIDTGKPGDSVGDMLIFDQPLLDADMKKIGTNTGTCIRTRIAHSFQCQWTLEFEDSSIQVAGREFEQGSSAISIVGGTGKYSGISGEMKSVNNNDGTFTQTLRYWIR